MRHRAVVVPVLGALLSALLGAGSVGVAPAAAEPTTLFSAKAAATWFTGQAFDTCTAPSLSAMTAWLASPFRGIGIYAGGENRTCRQPNLTPAWVASVSAMGWKLLPIHLGPQSRCTERVGTKISNDPATAAQQGAAAGDAAIAAVFALGIRPGSTIYYDLENCTATDAACREAALSFVSGYVRQLHLKGWTAGVYANLSSGAVHLSDVYHSARHARPDALWVARWDGVADLRGWAGIDDRRWSMHQRLKQYRGDHDETHGGVTLNIDSNVVDAQVATVAGPYSVINGSTSSRTGPSTGAAVVDTIEAGEPLSVVCQITGSAVLGNPVWNKLSSGRYVPDHHVNTPSKPGFSTELPRCAFPFQVEGSDRVIRRAAPSAAATRTGTLWPVALAWVICQGPGSRVAGTTVWNQVPGGWVSDHDVSTPSRTRYNSQIPRCA